MQDNSIKRSLHGKVAVVAGATRGAGRGIAHMLGEAGATVYCSGRSTTGKLSPIGRAETIDETAQLVAAAGGYGIAVQTDHSEPEQVHALFERVKIESKKLDLLVNDIGAENLAVWDTLENADLSAAFKFLDAAVQTHIITTHGATRLLREQQNGLIVEITDGNHHGYRGAFFYDLAKTQLMRLAYATSRELEPHGIVALALTPGFLRSEAMLDAFGVSEANWQDASSTVMGFSESETPCFVGRAVAALAADPQVARFNGQALASWDLAKTYGFTDIDGRSPHWMKFATASLRSIVDKGGPENEAERGWVDAWCSNLRDQSEHKDLLAQLERFTP